MRLKYFLGILSVLAVFMGIVLLQDDESSLKIITSPSIHSYKQTTSVEKITLPILMNQKDNYYVNPTYIDQIELLNGDELIPLTIKEIKVNEDVYKNDESYSLVHFIVEIGFYSEDYLISLTDCYLHVTYQSKEEFSVYIGEFHYLFDNIEQNDLSVGNYKATVFEHSQKKTISGINVELFNNSNKNIVIKDIQFISDSVALNNDYSKLVIEDIDMFDSVERVLLKEFPIVSYQVDPNEHVCYKDESVNIYVPASYTGDIDFLHRATIIITYEKDGYEYQMSLDDFPFISTSIFQDEYKDSFRYYEYPN